MRSHCRPNVSERDACQVRNPRFPAQGVLVVDAKSQSKPATCGKPARTLFVVAGFECSLVRQCPRVGVESLDPSPTLCSPSDPWPGWKNRPAVNVSPTVSEAPTIGGLTTGRDGGWISWVFPLVAVVAPLPSLRDTSAPRTKVARGLRRLHTPPACNLRYLRAVDRARHSDPTLRLVLALAVEHDRSPPPRPLACAARRSRFIHHSSRRTIPTLAMRRRILHIKRFDKQQKVQESRSRMQRSRASLAIS